MLYTISVSPYYIDLNSLFSLLTDQDTILLLQDGVLMGHKDRSLFRNINLLNLIQLIKNQGISIFALQDDVAARGLMKYMSSDIHQISYVDFVHLTVRHMQYFAWQ